jgi:uncharacterized protein (TIGR04255 family)
MAPPLMPMREEFGTGPGILRFGFDMVAPEMMPRAWFISGDDTMLVQLQSDRLLLNWRKGEQGAEYPHFAQVTAEFQRVYRDFEAFVKTFGLGNILPSQCEMTYVSHLYPEEPEGELPHPARFFRLWSDSQGPEFPLPLDDLSFNARYLLRREDGQPFGRLSAGLSTLPTPNGSGRMFQIDLTARGEPAYGGLEGVVHFHEMAHEQLVQCFTGITRPEAHQIWERSQ